MCEVESILNSRPLTVFSDDPRDSEPLTPNHLLLLKSDSPMPPGVFQRDDLFSRRWWRQIQYLADIFWKRWSREYLPLLQSRQKWLHPRRNLTVGDVVLVAAENTNRNYWPLGRIQQVFPDKKGFVRKVKVKVKSAVLERSVDKLVLLVEKEESKHAEPWELFTSISMDSSSDNILTLSFKRFQQLFSKRFCSVIFRLSLWVVML